MDCEPHHKMQQAAVQMLFLVMRLQTTLAGDHAVLPDDVGARYPAGCVVGQHYEIIRLLGRGGMGEVYLAQDTRLGRLVAIKLLLQQSKQSIERFILEAQTTAQCHHENIVVVHDLVESESVPYMVLEYIAGLSLREAMADCHKALQAIAVEIMLPVVRALECAHAMGIVHRDLKPENILLADSGQIKVVDFGIAKQVTPNPFTAFPARATPLDPHFATQDGHFKGTLPYMSPEQWEDDGVDGRTDIWAVGIVLFELLAGKHPFDGQWASQLALIPDLDAPMPSAREKMPYGGALAEIIDRCLKKRKEERWASAAELAMALEKVREQDLASAVEPERVEREIESFEVRPGRRQHDAIDFGHPFGKLPVRWLEPRNFHDDDVSSRDDDIDDDRPSNPAYFGAWRPWTLDGVAPGQWRRTPSPRSLQGARQHASRRRKCGIAARGRCGTHRRGRNHGLDPRPAHAHDKPFGSTSLRFPRPRRSGACGHCARLWFYLPWRLDRADGDRHEPAHNARGAQSAFVIHPARLLQHDAITVMVFERSSAQIPIRVHGHDLLEARCNHASTRLFPFGHFGKIKHEQILGRGPRRNRMRTTIREFKMVLHSGATEHDAVEAFMIVKAANDSQAEPRAIKIACSRQIRDRTGNA